MGLRLSTRKPDAERPSRTRETPAKPLRRLGISGSAGTGKTSLATALSRTCSTPVVEEGMRRRLEAGLDLHEVDAAGHRALLIELFDEMMAGIEAAERREGGFVSDRTPLDFMAFWLYYGMGWDAAASDAAMARFAAGLARYDAVVLLPWGAIPLEDDGIRSPNRWHQYHFQMILEGLLGSVEAAPPILRMPAAIVSPDARLGWLIEAVGMETVDRVAP